MNKPISCDNILGPIQLLGCTQKIQWIGSDKEVLCPSPISTLIPSWFIQVDPSGRQFVTIYITHLKYIKIPLGSAGDVVNNGSSYVYTEI